MAIDLDWDEFTVNSKLYHSHMNQLKAAVNSKMDKGTAVGGWAVSEYYAAEALTVNDSTLYVCTQAHTAAVENEPGVGDSWEVYWFKYVGDVYTKDETDALLDGKQDAADMPTDVPANETDPITGAVTGLVKADGAGNISAAEEGEDYYGPGGTTIPVAGGGTGAGTAEGARTNLSIYSIDDINSLLEGKQNDLNVPTDEAIATGTSTDEIVLTIAKLVYAIQQHGQITTRLRINTTTTTEPTDEEIGDIFLFDNDTLDPSNVPGTTPYIAITTAQGSPGTYKALVDVAGNVLFESIAALINYVFDSTPDTDDTWQGSRASFVAGESISQWDIIYLKYNTDGPRAYMYNANSTDSDNDTYRPMGIALAVGTAGSAFNVGIGFGIARNDGWTFTDATDEGKPIFAGETDGAITLTRPSDSGDHIIHLGNIIDEDEIMFSFGNITDVVVP